jgi:hypothetical protein
MPDDLAEDCFESRRWLETQIVNALRIQIDVVAMLGSSAFHEFGDGTFAAVLPVHGGRNHSNVQVIALGCSSISIAPDKVFVENRTARI